MSEIPTYPNECAHREDPSRCWQCLTADRMRQEERAEKAEVRVAELDGLIRRSGSVLRGVLEVFDVTPAPRMSTPICYDHGGDPNFAPIAPYEGGDAGPPRSSKAVPVCVACDDTQRMRTEPSWACTSCPRPCGICRQGGNGPFCEHTPCICECHRDTPSYENYRKRLAEQRPNEVLKPASPPVARIIRERGWCGHVTPSEPSDVACILTIGHDGGIHEPFAHELPRPQEPLPNGPRPPAAIPHCWMCEVAKQNPGAGCPRHPSDDEQRSGEPRKKHCESSECDEKIEALCVQRDELRRERDELRRMNEARPVPAVACVHKPDDRGCCVSCGTWTGPSRPDEVSQSFWDGVQEEANDLAQTLAQGRKYHGAGKHSSDWHEGWEACAKPFEASLRQLLSKHSPRPETAVPDARDKGIEECVTIIDQHIDDVNERLREAEKSPDSDRRLFGDLHARADALGDVADAIDSLKTVPTGGESDG